MRRLGAIVVVAVLGAVACGFGAGSARAATHGFGVLSLTTSAKSLPSGGGRLVLTARVRGATSCAFVGPLTPFAVLIPLDTVPCASGRARTTIRVDANNRAENATLDYYVRAYDSHGHNVLRESTIVELGSTGTPGGKTPASAMVIDTAGVPTGFLNTAYAGTLGASGGKGPYSWSVTSGSLPAGLTLSPTGSIAGTPTASGTTTFTVQARDAAAKQLSATAPVTVAVTTPLGAPTTTPTDVSSANWSGYTAYGGPFTAATGTFTVPTVVANGTEGHTSEWVGIDGGTPSDTSLIQAGVEEDVGTGSAVTTYAWWEILPAVETPISLPVSPGDIVTISISALTQGQWRISIVDNTNGGEFSIDQAYSGNGSTAEWIVEAPTDALSNKVVNLAQYTPNVVFTNLGLVGAPSSLARMLLGQNSKIVSTPSTLSANGFTTAYGSSTPPPP